MRSSGIVVSSPTAFVCATVLACSFSSAQYQPPSEKLVLSGKTATTWSQDHTDIALIDGPVTIELDRATLTARQAVVWISPDPDRPGTRRVEVALIGDAKLRQPDITRTGPRMFVGGNVAGKIQLKADERFDRALNDSAVFKIAESMRAAARAETLPTPTEPHTPSSIAPAPVVPAPGPDSAPRPAGSGPLVQPAQPILPGIPPTIINPPPIQPLATIPDLNSEHPVTSTAPSTAPATGPSTALAGPVTQNPVIFQAPELETIETEDNHVAVVLSRGVTLIQHRPNGDLIELQSERAVLYTTLRSLRDLQKTQQTSRIENSISGAYLEGDVRIVLTPGSSKTAEQRLVADRVYYEFATDRAILTNAIIRQVDPKLQIPFNIRAKRVRQLALGEFNAEKVQLSTSSFARPSYEIGASKIYVRQEPGVGDQLASTVYQANDAKFQFFGVPLFYLPSISGSISSNQSALREISVGKSSQFGYHAGADLGLFESLGYLPPKDLDLSYRAEYFSDRGPAGGLDGSYQGGFITENTREPWSFEGNFHSYFVYDHGTDEIGRPVPERTSDQFRGEALFEHQHYFPDNWQLQLRAGYVSDQEFLEQWFPRDYDQDLPHDFSAYVKHQKDNEAYTFLVQFQPNDLVTTSDLLQEQFEVEHIPEIGYHRIGQSIFDGRGTLFSDNTFAGLYFQRTRASLKEQGFTSGYTPGIPSLGTTGLTDSTVYRGDFRQEFDFPFQAGNFKVVPYLLGRYTAYSDSPTGDAKNRLMAGAGARVTTAFWKTDDAVESELFDLHRMRHLIEPELNLFASAQTVDRNDVFIYDEQIDPVNDLSAAQIAVRQRWQTYRGGPGRWRSVDFLTLNVEADLFANQPRRGQLNPYDFRGLYFSSQPELSVPRNAINADASWRISDSTVILADLSENLDKSKLATASVGLVTRRGENLVYYLGTRYISDLHSNITTAAVEYELSRKYTIQLAQSFDFGQGENVTSELGIVRKFDSFFVAIKAYTNETTNQSGFGINFYPNGIKYGFDSGAFGSVLNQRR